MDFVVWIIRYAKKVWAAGEDFVNVKINVRIAAGGGKCGCIQLAGRSLELADMYVYILYWRDKQFRKIYYDGTCQNWKSCEPSPGPAFAGPRVVYLVQCRLVVVVVGGHYVGLGMRADQRSVNNVCTVRLSMMDSGGFCNCKINSLSSPPVWTTTKMIIRWPICRQCDRTRFAAKCV